jgi:glycosyltransferase involved in cell wall biosynthesis
MSNLKISMESKVFPLVTIITVVYNGGRYIEDTIRSVINQSYKNLDYIVIDGGSTDNTLEIIKQYNESITFWNSEKDNGIYDAMNKGWNAAKEGFILYLGAGDKITSLPSEIPLSESKNNIYFGRVLIGNKPYNSIMNYRIRLGNTIHHQALLIYKNSDMHDPFNINLKIFADYDFNARLFNEKYNFIFLEDFEAYALPGGISSTVYLKEMLGVVRSNFGIFWTLIAVIYQLIQGFKHGYRYTFK